MRLATACLLAAFATALPAQIPPANTPPLTFEQEKSAAGDAPPDPGPLATDLSPALTRPAIDHALRKVADWQIRHSQSRFNQDWTYAPLYLGLLAATQATGDPRYQAAVIQTAESFHWQLWHYRAAHADDEALGQAYELLYQQHPDPIRLADTRATMDALLARQDDPQKDLWWWCDALFMAPPTLARLAAITGDHRYLDKMNAEWSLTQGHLYDPTQHLFSRDATFLTKTEPDGQKLFWSRGNGWVLAGLANLLQTLPKTDPARPAYEQLFRDMAARIAALQPPDGLWRAGLLDPAAYPQPEISGSAFFTYAMTWGINNGLLPRAAFLPVVQRAWAGVLQHIYADGRLGNIQPIGAAPDAVSPSSSYVYGTGAFLLAAAELHRLAPVTPATAKTGGTRHAGH